MSGRIKEMIKRQEALQRMTQAQLEQMRDVDILTVDPQTLVDRKTVHVNEKLPREQRVRQYVRDIKNPYCYLDDDDGIGIPSSFFRRNNPENGRFRNTSPRKCWDGTNIRVILQRFEYTGACVFKKKAWKGIDNPKTKTLDKSQWMIVPGCHESIISEDEYDKAQAVIRRMKAAQPSAQSYPLRSLIRCGVCGRMMRRNAYCKHINYSCTLSQHSANPDCPVNEHFYEDKLEAAVIGSLRQMLMLLVEHKKLVDAAASKSKGSKANLRQSLLRIEKSKKQNKLSRETAYEKYVDGQISREDFLSMRDKLAGELSKLNEEKASIESGLAAYEAAKDSELTLLGQEAESFLKTKEVTNQMLLHFIDRVCVQWNED